MVQKKYKTKLKQNSIVEPIDTWIDSWRHLLNLTKDFHVDGSKLTVLRVECCFWITVEFRLCQRRVILSLGKEWSCLYLQLRTNKHASLVKLFPATWNQRQKKLTDWCFTCKPESFFYINIYFSNRFLIQLIMENIPNFKMRNYWLVWRKPASVSSLDEIKCKWIIVKKNNNKIKNIKAIEIKKKEH